MCSMKSERISSSASVPMIVLQKDNAVLKVEKTYYLVGKKLRAKCISPTTLFPINITWFVNDQEISNNKPLTLRVPNEFKTYSSLEYDVLSTNQLKIRCVFSYFNKIHSDVEVVVNKNIYDMMSSVNEELSEVKSICSEINS
ncbi:uncharacterized protein LOC126909417 [Daktulosphaira vitifoliae]|uniref:uncharacterized protein LOC126909417 n=1 Tax=Daktulosphaira vitifoliae TaxID=58002 RepID=UPI0021A9CAB8|nr:uncharacterized protein LOC126909417 [Daktulosphaira vitifoliae]